MERTFAEELRKKYGVELGERIGRGAFGEVYRATGSGGACAVKKSLDPVDISEAWVNQELEGLKLVKRVKGHPHIVTLFDVWRVQGYLVTRWELGQQSLADRLKECQNKGLPGIPREELLPYMEQAALAIDFLNGKGIYHRDIKPENLVLFHGYVKLADLGLAKFVGASTGSHSGSGTLGYTPPEAHDDRLTKSSDLYALAATYIKLRTGHEPFGSNPKEIMKRQEAGQPILDGLDEREKEAVRHALAYRPEDRPQSGQAWVEILTKGRSVPPPPAQTPPPSSPITGENEQYRHLRFVSQLKRLLRFHEVGARLVSLSWWPIVVLECIVLGLIAFGVGGGLMGAILRVKPRLDTDIDDLFCIGVGLALCCAVICLRQYLRRKAAARTEHNISTAIEALQTAFPKECQLWGGISVLRDGDLVRDIVADLETKRMAN